MLFPIFANIDYKWLCLAHGGGIILNTQFCTLLMGEDNENDLRMV